MDATPNSTPLRPLLIAEDDANDALLMRRACVRAGLLAPILHASNGEEAIAELQRLAAAASGDSLPSLVLLDIKMPRLDGFEVLKWLKSRPELSGIPAVILSSSALPADLERARLLGASSYCVKPSAFQDLVALIASLKRDWLDR